MTTPQAQCSIANDTKNYSGFLNIGAVNIALKQFSLLLLVVSLLLMSRLFLVAKYRPAQLRFVPLAPSILVYVCFHIVGAAVSIPYNISIILHFYQQSQKVPSSEQSASHFAWIFWLGQWQNSYNAISPLPILFLTIERCTYLWMPGGPARKQLLERWLLFASVAAIGLSLAASTGFYLAELPLDVPALSCHGCSTASCLMQRYKNMPQLFFKCALSTANIVSCLLFLFTLRKYSLAAKQIRNRSVVITILFEGLFNIVPAFVSLGFSIFGQAPVSNVVSASSALDACCCAVYYSMLFLQRPWCLRSGQTNPASNLQKHEQMATRMPSALSPHTPTTAKGINTNGNAAVMLPNRRVVSSAFFVTRNT